MAIAGGISLDILAGSFNGMDMITSPINKMQTFSQQADGAIFSEGVGAFLLKPLKNAIKDRDHIHAVIKGGAINSDGTSNGISSPSRQAQEEVLIAAWKNARINPEELSYIEAHGTATNIGDPIEIKAITSAFRHYSKKRQFCAIGTAKVNIGHSIAVSGIAGLTKIILAMKYECIPPNINFNSPNKFVDFVQSPIYVNNSLKDWKRSNKLRRAGISAFGFSGTNCHIIVEEAPETIDKERSLKTKSDNLNIFVLSAKTMIH